MYSEAPGGDFAWGKTKTNTNHTIPCTVAGGPIPELLNDTSFFETQWDASLRAWVGALITPDTLAYLTGRMAWQRIEALTTWDATLSLVCFTTSLVSVRRQARRYDQPLHAYFHRRIGL